MMSLLGKVVSSKFRIADITSTTAVSTHVYRAIRDFGKVSLVKWCADREWFTVRKW
jgi:hypothetical protein